MIRCSRTRSTSLRRHRTRDVGTNQEYASERIEKSLLIPLNEFENRINELFEEDDLLIYWELGARARQKVPPKPRYPQHPWFTDDEKYWITVKPRMVFEGAR